VAQLARDQGLSPEDPGTDAAVRFGETHALDELPERTGRAKTSPAILRQVARIIRDAKMAGHPYAPAVVEHFRRKGLEIQESTERTCKRKAIKRGLLKVPNQVARASARGLLDTEEG